MGACRETVASGAACDRFGRSFVCPMDEVCAFTTAAGGTCGTPVAETAAPNDTPAMAQGPVTGATTFRGAISTEGDVDCYAITIGAADHGLVIETSDGAGSCPPPADTIATLFDTDGTTVLDENDDAIPGALFCSRIDGTQVGPARDLAPGTYTACVRAFGSMDLIDTYVLSVVPVP